MRNLVLLALLTLSTILSATEVIKVTGYRPPQPTCDGACMSYDDFQNMYGDQMTVLDLSSFDSLEINIQAPDEEINYEQCDADRENLANAQSDLRAKTSQREGTRIAMNAEMERLANMRNDFNETYDAGLIIPMREAQAQILIYQDTITRLNGEINMLESVITSLTLRVQGCPRSA